MREQVKQIYDSVAKTYDTRYKSTRHFVEEELIAGLTDRLEPLGTCLSLGCGTGEDISLFQIMPEEFFGVDISLPMLNRAIIKYPDYRFELWDAETPVKGRYHTVLGIFGFINYAGLQPFIDNLHSSHAKQFIAVCYSREYAPDYSSAVVTHYDINTLRESLAEAGYQVGVAGVSFPTVDEDELGYEALYIQQSMLTYEGNVDGCRYWVLTGRRD